LTRAAVAAATLGALLLLAGCGSDNGKTKGNPGFFDKMFSGNSGPTVTCPNVAKVADVSRVTRFKPSGRDLTDVLFEGAVGRLGGSCGGTDDGISVDMTIEFLASRGPADTARRAPFTYFVAIVDKNDNVLAREQFDSAVEFPGNQTRSAVVEELEEDIPMKDKLQGNQYRVFVGFVLTPEEIAFNRAHPTQ
jgi:hypothetical protein